MGKEKKIIREEDWGRVIVMDSAAQMGTDEAGQIVVIGSHGAEPAARHVARFLPFGVILNDAGKGRNNAGISGLAVLEAMNILGATVDCMSARIGDGQDSYGSGVISAINGRASAAGVRLRMPARDACALMASAKESARQLYVTERVFQNEAGMVFLADSISFLNKSHSGSVVVCGSHCARTTFDFVKDLGLKGIILNDAGKGKEDEGISGLPVYDRAGIPAAAVDCMTAEIGNARDAWQSGLVSSVNERAARQGVCPGMIAQEAAKLFLAEAET
jgi:hypothetical protein